MNLYIDTTFNITVGLLDENYLWVELVNMDSNKSSTILHSCIYSLLKKHNKKITDVCSVFYAAGPGSYTGMRVSDGIAKILKENGIKVYSFYHFEIPRALGLDDGLFISKAFKGEYFVFDIKQDSKLLIKESKIEELVNGYQLYTNDSTLSFANIQITKDLLEKKSQDFFRKVADLNQNKELYYYRELEDEFSRK